MDGAVFEGAKMIEELKQVRDALNNVRMHKCMFDCDVDFEKSCIDVNNAIATLDRIIAEQTPDASKMVVPDSDIFPKEVWLAKGEHSKPLYQVENTKFSKVLYVRADKAMPDGGQDFLCSLSDAMFGGELAWHTMGLDRFKNEIIKRLHDKEMKTGSLSVTDYTFTEDNFSDKMSRVIMNVVDVFGRFPEQRIDGRAWRNLLIYCPQFKELNYLIQLSYSHVDGRDLFAELKPRNTLNITRRVDGKEMIFEADWLTDFGDQLRKLEAMLSAAPEPAQPEKLDVEALKREVISAVQELRHNDLSVDAGSAITEVIDHLAEHYDFVRKV